MPLKTGWSVLLSSAGRRTTLLRHFQVATHRRGGRVIASDANPNAPAMRLADAALVCPRLDDPSFVTRLLERVSKHRIRLVVPTIDTELPILVRAAPALARRGCLALVSDAPLVRICGDKWLTVRHFASKGFLVPRSWLPGDLNGRLPAAVFVRPRAGSASIDAFAVPRSRLEGVLPLIKAPIIQERIRAQEITVDALLDLKGRLIHYVPRKRVKTVGGESVEGVTISDAALRPWFERLFGEVADLGGRGPMTVQAFLTPRGPMLSEINPRFGGGYPLAAAAGGAYPEWILRMFEGRDVPSRVGKYTLNLWMSRYYVELFSKGG